MNRKFLSILDFDSLMEVDINEIEEQEPEISADEPDGIHLCIAGHAGCRPPCRA